MRLAAHELCAARTSTPAALLSALLGFASLTALPAEPVAAPAPAALKIGLVLPPGEPEAESIRRGAEIGARLAGRSLGREVELIVRGSPGQWGTEGDDAVALALDAGAQALIAPTTGAAVHLVEQVAGRSRIPVVSLCGDASVTGARIPWALRLVPETADEARLLFARAGAFPDKPVKRWAALMPAGRSGREAAKDLGRAAKAAGCEIGEVVMVPAADGDLTALVKQATRANPEGLLLWLEPVMAGRLARAARASGHAGWLAGPGRLGGPSFLKEAGPAAEGVLATRPVRTPASAIRHAEFLAAYTAQFHDPPDPGAETAADAVRLLAAVLREAGSRPAFALLPPRDEQPGITGPLRFDSTGNRLVELELVIARNGRFERSD
jgi:ABC-type branched-subunit amino acid transport system substrate-binding protein